MRALRFLKKTIPYGLGIAGFCALFLLVSAVLKPKWLFDTDARSPETEILLQFYEEPKASIDVIFLGSSHVYDGINPLDFYQETGLTGYVMSSSNQDLATSYFYLKEALRLQKPVCVMLDIYGFREECFGDRASYKRSLDYMRWSEVKLEAVQRWLEALEDGKESLLARIFTIMDYHSRWEELGELDFTYRSQFQTQKGFVPVFTGEEYTHVYEAEEPLEITDLTAEYFEKIVKLCREADVQLVLIDIPNSKWSPGYTASVNQLAIEYQIPLWDFNEAGLFGQIGFDTLRDFRDPGHLNAYGAKRFTDFLGEYFLDNYAVHREQSDEVRAAWRDAQENWEKLWQRSELQGTDALEEYLQKAKDPDYLVFVVSQKDFTLNLTDAAKEGLRKMGSELTDAFEGTVAYCGIFRDGSCIRETLEETETLSLEGREEGLRYSLRAIGQLTEEQEEKDCSIVLNDEEYALKRTGLNLVVYSLEQKKVVDTVNFNTHTNENAKR